MKSLLCKVIGHNWSRTRRKVSTKSRRKKAIDVKNQWHQKCHRCNKSKGCKCSSKKETNFCSNYGTTPTTRSLKLDLIFVNIKRQFTKFIN